VLQSTDREDSAIKPLLLIFFATPNGNTIEQTIGKQMQPGDDWHFNIQHIGAQTRFLRNILTNQTIVVAYLENSLKSWPAWRRNEAERNTPLAQPGLSPLDLRWELSDDAKLGSFNLRAYKPVYLMPALWSNRRNPTPGSPNPDNQVEDPLDLQPIEAKFQLSLKTKVAQGLFFGEGDLWFGYTQSSRWQVFNSRTSRPFRETIYEPEAMLVFDGRLELPGWDLRMLSLGLNHQSNGRSLPFSRSWNRVMAQIALERDDWMLLLRPWWRISESAEDDDNPDIADFLGRGDLTLVHRRGEHEFALMARRSLRSGERSRGAVQFDWSFPLSRSLRGHVQVFDGYGESLIDYNQHSTAFGLGVSFFEWL